VIPSSGPAAPTGQPIVGCVHKHKHRLNASAKPSGRFASAPNRRKIGAEGYGMATKHLSSFDPKLFLAKIGDGRGIGKYRKDQIVFSQGDPADAVFYVQKGKVKLTVVSERGREAVIAILGTDEFFGEGCLAGEPRDHRHHLDNHCGSYAARADLT
jgi:hypothetical protein